MSTVRAKYENGVLMPLDPLDLEEGEEVVLSIEDAIPQTNGKESISGDVRQAQELRALRHLG